MIIPRTMEILLHLSKYEIHAVIRYYMAISKLPRISTNLFQFTVITWLKVGTDV